MSASAKPSLANLISTLRIILTVPFAWSVLEAPGRDMGWLAAALFAVIAASDFIDGRVARRTGTASAAGQALDHGADIGFLLTAFAAYVALGLVPWWVPAAIAVAFTTYVLDSLRRSEQRPSLIGSRIGHAGGVCNYALVGVLVGNYTMALYWLPRPLMQGLFALVPLYSAASIASRLLAGWRREALIAERW